MAPKQNRYQVLRSLWQEVRLAWALFNDPRVPTWAKVLVPSLWLGYLLFPLDIVPDVLPFLGEVDDLMLFLLLVRLFINLSPPDVVREVEARMRGKAKKPDPDIIEGTYRVLDE